MQPNRSTKHGRAMALLAPALLGCTLQAQSPAPAPETNRPSTPTVAAGPIAIVPVGNDTPGEAATVTGSLEVTGGKAIIGASGSITSGTRTTNVALPRRGTLRVCPFTVVKLAADTSAPAGTTPGLLMAMDGGAVEMSFASTSGPSNADILLTPDFRILINGPGASEVKVRLGVNGDTCVDNSGGNAGLNAPYVVVTSFFDNGLYRVQPGQRVMFQHGSLHEVVDAEKEPCGCPPAPPTPGSNDFPLAQSEGLAPTSPSAPAPAANAQSALVYSAREHAPTAAIPPLAPAEVHSAPTPAPSKPAPEKAKKKTGFFTRIGRLFRRFFGAD